MQERNTAPIGYTMNQEPGFSSIGPGYADEWNCLVELTAVLSLITASGDGCPDPDSPDSYRDRDYRDHWRCGFLCYFLLHKQKKVNETKIIFEKTSLLTNNFKLRIALLSKNY